MVPHGDAPRYQAWWRRGRLGEPSPLWRHDKNEHVSTRTQRRHHAWTGGAALLTTPTTECSVCTRHVHPYPWLQTRARPRLLLSTTHLMLPLFCFFNSRLTTLRRRRKFRLKQLCMLSPWKPFLLESAASAALTLLSEETGGFQFWKVKPSLEERPHDLLQKKPSGCRGDNGWLWLWLKNKKKVLKWSFNNKHHLFFLGQNQVLYIENS